jgi:transcriptional regulator of acetoin/glycerol metabolism
MEAAVRGGGFKMFVRNGNFLEIRRLIENDRIDLKSLNGHVYRAFDDCFSPELKDELFRFFFETYCLEEGKHLLEVEDLLEKAFVIWALLKCDGQRKSAARMLGIGYCTIFKKIKKYGITC